VVSWTAFSPFKSDNQISKLPVRIEEKINLELVEVTLMTSLAFLHYALCLALHFELLLL